jgi:broad specificity phosphatase PhoE
MVENRTLPFLLQLEEWLRQHPANVAISCHGNSLRPIRRVFEHLSLKQMLQIENPQDRAMSYALHVHSVNIGGPGKNTVKADWQGVLVPQQVRLATDPRNPLKRYY